MERRGDVVVLVTILTIPQVRERASLLLARTEWQDRLDRLERGVLAQLGSLQVRIGNN